MESNGTETVDLDSNARKVAESRDVGFREKIRDKQYRSQLLHSICIAGVLFNIGITEGQAGPAFLDLQLITNTNLEKASAFFTLHSCGYLLGSIFNGVIGKKINSSLLIFIGLLCLGVCTIVTPYCSHFGFMVFVKGISGIFAGIADSKGNAEHMRIWGNDGQVLMQLLHFAFALGGVVAPLITEPFLATRMDDDAKGLTSHQLHKNHSINTEANISAGRANDSISANMSVMCEDNATRCHPVLDSPSSNIHYAFLITGVFTLAGSVPFLVLSVRSRSLERKGCSKTPTKTPYRTLPTGLHVFMVLMLCACYVFYNCVEDTFASFLMTFVVRQYTQVTKSRGAYITAVYWASFAVSRFIMIFLSKALTSLRLLFLCGSLMSVAFLCFMVSSLYGHVTALTIFAAMAGFSMSAVFPAGMTWSESELLRVTSRVSSCIFVSASTGAMLNPLLVGFLINEVDNMWFCYVLLLEVAAMSSLFLSLLLFNRLYVNKHYGHMRPVLSINIRVSVDTEANESATKFIENGTDSGATSDDKKK